MSKPTKRWWRTAALYRRFADDDCDFSDAAAQAMFDWESRGDGDLSLSVIGGHRNGFAIGKHWLNVQVAAWRQDIADGLLTRAELEDDYPAWFLDGALT